MLILALGLVLLMMGIVLYKLKDKYNFSIDQDWIQPVSIVIGLVIIVASIGCMTVGMHSDKVRLLEYKSVEQTIEEARKGNLTLENATLTHTIITINRELAGIKYYNNSLWTNWFVLDELAEMEFLK